MTTTEALAWDYMSRRLELMGLIECLHDFAEHHAHAKEVVDNFIDQCRVQIDAWHAEFEKLRGNQKED